MYGWLLESVQHFIVEECGEEIWETILREAGARNTVFSATQQYPDTLMLRLASALARFLNKDPNSPSPSRPSSPGPRKLSLKSKPSWRSASVNTDGRVGFRCPFTATNALTAATKKEIHAYTSSEELAAQTLSVERINEEVELEISKNKALNRRSLGIKLEHHNTIDVVELPSSPINGEKQNEKESNPLLESSLISEDKTQTNLKCGKNRKSSTAEPSTSKEPMCPNDSKTTSPMTSSPERKTSILKSPKAYKSTAAIEDICQSESKTTTPTTSSPERKTSSILKSPKANKAIAIAGSSNSEGEKTSEPMSPVSFNSEGKPALKPIRVRKSSVTVALDVYRRRGSGVPVRPRLNSLSHINVSGDKLSVLREKFGTPEKVMHFFGRCFVKFFSNYGYDTMIRATGRYFCTFLQSVDSIHQRMRFTFPRMRSPSMQLTRSHIHGAELVYSSTRTGFTHYLMGQLYEIAEDIFSLKLKVSIVKESMEGSYYNAVLRLEFDNSDYVQSQTLRKNLPCPLPSVPVSLFLQLFPFGVLLDRKMKIISAGVKLIESWGGPYDRIEKQPISEILRLRKPKVSFTWDKVVTMQTMIFELELMRWRGRVAGDARRGSQGARAVLFKGPIYFLQEIDALIFLCCPIFNDLEELQQADLFLADMNGHGLSKEMLLQGWQHLSRLELLFEKAEGRSLSLEKSCRLRDQWKSKGDQLVYSMIPKSLAFHLRAGKDPMAACQAYDSVTVMFCGLQVGEAGTRADVMQTVDYINDVYSRIDRLLDSHRVYKVETVGTVYMLVAGAPERARAHAASAAGAALAISRALPMLTIGVHSGPCVAGVLGLKLPRFCLVGDTVNTASRMQTTSEPGRVHVSTQTANELPARFRLRRRGLIKVKGKGMMETFWLEGELEEDDQDEALQLFSALCGDN